MIRVAVHPSFDPGYYGFYWEGLRRLGADIRLSAEGFPDADDSGFFDAKDTFAMRVETGVGTNRLYISADDHADLRRPALDWADRLGKVNLPPEDDPAGAGHDIVAIGPSFGIRAWPLPTALRLARTAHRVAPAALRNRRQVRQFVDQGRRRLPEDRYQPTASDQDFIFFAAWPWVRHPEVNPPRAEFIRACHRQPDLHFEGGFAPRRRGNPEAYEGLYATKRYPLRRYLDLMGRSAVAFNNPAVHGCLGWKLGEFLALGKAIISLPLERRLPAPLEHGVHMHYVDGTPESLDDALDRLRYDLTYRRELESAARGYYDDWLRPEVVMGRLLDGWV